MTGKKWFGGAKLRYVLALVLIGAVAAATAGLYYAAVVLPLQGDGQAPENDASPILGKNKDDTSPDGTNCHNVHNLQEENRVAIAAPTVVDMNESTGNILVRGPLPLVLRESAGVPPQTYGCMNKSDWYFAYDNLNGMIAKEKDVHPAYFTSSKTAALQAEMQDFNLSDYHVIVISLLNTGDNTAYFDIEKAAFGGSYSRCSASPADGTIHGEAGNLIWSTTDGCTNDQQCQALLHTDGDTCSYSNLMTEMTTLMSQKDPDGKPRLIYYHCTHGTDRTGAVTMGYLLKTMPSMNFSEALRYTTNMGQESSVPSWPPNGNIQNLVKAYCKEIGGNCGDSGSLSGTGTSPVSTTAITRTPTPQATATALPVQTPVPSGAYTPGTSGF